VAKSIIIIGAGMGGLAAGIYGQANGFETRIFEMHSLPGGQCASWKQGGYTFDACIHHLFGCSPASRIYELWQELGAMPREMVQPAECVSVLSPEGKLFRDHYDLEKLESHMLALAPSDAPAVRDYIRGIKAFGGRDILGDLMLGSTADKLKALPATVGKMRWFRPSMEKFGRRFTDPFLRRAFPLLVYSMPAVSLFIHLVRHAYGLTGALQWPVGGALKFALSIANRYKSLGGEIEYNARVARILVENGQAVGVRLADGHEHRADVVISDADGRRTIMELLEGKFVDDKVRKACEEPPDETNWSAHVFLGVRRDLSAEPSAMIMLFDEPVEVAGHQCDSLEMQIYGFDQTMAPEGKGVIKVELVSKYSYWKALAADRTHYEEEKGRVAEQVLGILERRFPGIKGQVEEIDVPTQLTWERYMGGTHGFANFPNKKATIWSGLRGAGGDLTLPGLEGFYFAGVWSSLAGSLFGNALSGRRAIREICRREGKRFGTAGLRYVRRGDREPENDHRSP
jgi:phytoene dehydrogenase-like protein